MQTSPLPSWHKVMKKHFEDGMEELMFNESELIVALTQELSETEARDSVASKRAALLRQSLKNDTSDVKNSTYGDNKS